MLMGVAAFFTVSLGGLLIGIIIGALTALITKFTKHVRGKTVLFKQSFLIYYKAYPCWFGCVKVVFRLAKYHEYMNYL